MGSEIDLGLGGRSINSSTFITAVMLYLSRDFLERSLKFAIWPKKMYSKWPHNIPTIGIFGLKIIWQPCVVSLYLDVSVVDRLRFVRPVVVTLFATFFDTPLEKDKKVT
jgi:hypothetical protein